MKSEKYLASSLWHKLTFHGSWRHKWFQQQPWATQTSACVLRGGPVHAGSTWIKMKIQIRSSLRVWLRSRGVYHALCLTLTKVCRRQRWRNRWPLCHTCESNAPLTWNRRHSGLSLFPQQPSFSKHFRLTGSEIVFPYQQWVICKCMEIIVWAGQTKNHKKKLTMRSQVICLQRDANANAVNLLTR